jgi:hypothetical protein
MTDHRRSPREIRERLRVHIETLEWCLGERENFT